jgi:hypothetical protein
MKTTKKSVKRRSQKLSVSAPNRLEKGYDDDFFLWTKSQAKLLKSGELNKLDIENLIEEIESLGKSDKRALLSHLIVLLQHLLKKEYQPLKATKSWDRSISNAQVEIELLLKDSPSLKKQIPSLLEEAYPYARKKAAEETKLELKTFPPECPEKIKKHVHF